MDSWVAIDFETANEHRGSPCAVGMVAVEDGQAVQTYTSYIQPPPPVSYFSPFCVSIHGITPDKVVGAPGWTEALEAIVRFADGRPLVAHNAAFDLGVIRDACNQVGLDWPELRYACTLVIARRTWPLLSYSLPWVTEAAGFQLSGHHDAGADALAAAHVLKSRDSRAGGQGSAESAHRVADLVWAGGARILAGLLLRRSAADTLGDARGQSRRRPRWALLRPLGVLHRHIAGHDAGAGMGSRRGSWWTTSGRG